MVLIYYVHQRANEIDREKQQVYRLGEWSKKQVSEKKNSPNGKYKDTRYDDNGNENSNGNARQPEELDAYRLGETQTSRLDNYNDNYNDKHNNNYDRHYGNGHVGMNAQSSNKQMKTFSTPFTAPPTTAPKPSAPSAVLLDQAIQIPRAKTPIPPKDYDVRSNIEAFENRAVFERVSSIKSNQSASVLARRTMFNQLATETAQIAHHKRNSLGYDYGHSPPKDYHRRERHGSRQSSRPSSIVSNDNFQLKRTSLYDRGYDGRRHYNRAPPINEERASVYTYDNKAYVQNDDYNPMKIKRAHLGN